MKKLTRAIKYRYLYMIRTTFYGWKVVYKQANDAWAIMKDGKEYCLDTKNRCYEYVCLA